MGAALLAVATLAVYAPVVGFDFISFDDPVYVTANPHVRAGLTWDGVVWATTAVHGANWHPFTWLSHMADVQVWGLWPGGHHLTSVVLHAAAAVFLFVALARMTKAPERSLVVAALFALHSTRVESVAWVSERKDVLSALLWFATLGAYASYVEAKTRSRYAMVLALYTLGLLAKPMLVTLPCTLVLLDYWPLARLVPAARAPASGPAGRTHALRAILLEKLPLLAIAAGASIITVIAQGAGGAVVSLDAITLGERVANALVAYLRYGAMLAWPAGLAFFYPLTPVTTGRAVSAAIVLVAVTAACIRRARRAPYLLVGWLWFVGTLVPVIGIVQVGQQSIADRYTYIPAVGLFLAAVWGVSDLLATWHASRWVATGAAIGILVLSSAGTVVQVGYWRNGETVFQRALAVTRDNFVAHMNLGHLASKRRDYALAEEHYRAALRIKPMLAEAYASLGTVTMAQGRDVEARAHLEHAIGLNPSLPEAHNALGLLATRSGDVAAARASFERAIAARPTYANARANLGDLLARTGDLHGAIDQYRQAVAAAPDDAGLNLQLGLALLSTGDPSGALAPLRAARASEPGNADVANALGTALLMADDAAGAVDALTEAVTLRPAWAEAHHHLAAALGSAGRTDAALAEIERTLALDPNLIEAYRSAAITLAHTGRSDEARGWLERGSERARQVGDARAAADLASETARLPSRETP